MKQILFLVFTLMVLTLTINSTVITDEYINYTELNETNIKNYSDFFTRIRRTVVTLNKKSLWKDGVIPYDFNFIVTAEQRRLIKIAMRTWEKLTCVQFVRRNEKLHTEYLYISKHPSCPCCYIEDKNYSQNKFVSFHNFCYHKHILLHELGHAIGFLHEHNHPDRDQYINVNFSTIKPKDQSLFQKYLPSKVDTLGLPYDRKSIMHYPSYLLIGEQSEEVSVSVPVPKISTNGSIAQNFELSDGDIAATHLMYQCSGCRETFFDPAGTFGHVGNGSITDFERCEWSIRAAEGERIKLTLNLLKIHQSYHCLLDYIEVRDGNTPNNPFLDRYCSKINKTKTYQTNNLQVVYVKVSHPDFTSAFEAKYETVCSQYVTLESGIVYNLESPNYPENYKPNKNCNWYFTAPENHRINMKFDFFAVESSRNCRNDHVSIGETNDLRILKIGTFCGIRKAWQVNSTENTLYVTFFSNDLREEKGFAATISTIVI